VTRKYPLDPLKRVRAEKVDKSARALSDALHKADSKAVEVERRIDAKEQLDQSVRETARGERERLERGELSAADLARGAAWSVAADMRRSHAARAVDEARREHTEARVDAEKKRSSFATVQAEAKVVDKHHERWRTARDAADAARDEDSAEEAHLARHEKGARR
jgi:hypothetical protein